MDPRDGMTPPGSASYYMPRGMTGSMTNVQGTTSMHQLLTGTNVPFQSSSGNSSVGQILAVDPSSTMSPRGNVGQPSALPQTEPVRRKRGRPRKYEVDSSKVSLALTPSPSAPAARSIPYQKRGRGRPPGTGRKQQLTSPGGWMSNSSGSNFTPHIIIVAVGEDIMTKIMSFLQQGPKAVCVLSATGSVTTATLRQPSTTYGGAVTYEGQFEILSLSGSYSMNNSGGSQGRTGGLSVSLASPDGRVIGGGVGGFLIAGSRVQVILGSFLCDGFNSKRKDATEGEGHLERQVFDNSLTLPDTQHNQNSNWPLQ